VYTQFFAATYPDAVAGVVLVDATHEETFEHLPQLSAWIDWGMALNKELRVAGISRLYPQSSHPTIRAFSNSNKHLEALGSEEETVARNLAELKAVEASLGNRPLIVLTSEQTNQVDFVRPLQAEFLTRSLQSKQIIVGNSGHSIHTAQPGAVVAAIREVVEVTRREQFGSSLAAAP